MGESFQRVSGLTILFLLAAYAAYAGPDVPAPERGTPPTDTTVQEPGRQHRYRGAEPAPNQPGVTTVDPTTGYPPKPIAGGQDPRNSSNISVGVSVPLPRRGKGPKPDPTPRQEEPPPMRIQ